MTNVELKHNLIAILGEDNVLSDEPMARHCSFRVGGSADFFLQVDRMGQLSPVLTTLKTAGEPYFILGRGTNLLVGDKGYRGAVITFTAAGAVPVTDTTKETSRGVPEIGTAMGNTPVKEQRQDVPGEKLSGSESGSAERVCPDMPEEKSEERRKNEESQQKRTVGGEDIDLNSLKVFENRIIAGAGVSLASVARTALEHGLSGLEFAAGIPGSVGGGIVMNAGAYGKEMKDVVESALLLMLDGSSGSCDTMMPADVNKSCDNKTTTGGAAFSAKDVQSTSGGQAAGIRQMTCEELHFGYRHSLLKESPAIVLQAAFHLHPDDPACIRARMMELASRRIEKQPLEYPSAGSTFKRPEGHFAGKLIQDAGLRGYRVGGACVSEKHCGFVINKDHATANDIRQVIRDVQAKVYESSGVCLEPEVIFLGEF